MYDIKAKGAGWPDSQETVLELPTSSLMAPDNLNQPYLVGKSSYMQGPEENL